MNVAEINPQNGTAITNLAQYVALALPLTILTVWVIIAFQSRYIYPRGTSFFKRLGWPVFLVTVISRKRQIEKLQNHPVVPPEFDYGGGSGNPSKFQ
jgi:hypothetical protein